MEFLMPASSQARGLALLAAAVLAASGLVLAGPAAAAEPGGPLGVPAFSSFDPMDNGDPVQVRTLSGRADLVSGGDAFIEVVVPAGTDLDGVKVSVGSRDVSAAFQRGGPGLRGLVTGLPRGASTITATLPDKSRASLVVKNASQGGPVFSGPLIEPWTCNNGSKARDCSQAPTVRYLYRSTDPTKQGLPGRSFAGAVSPGLQEYDPANPPSDVATTTTDEGTTVPFIVREETGYSLRDQYRIAALWDPKQGARPDPAAANPGFANKLVLSHGFSCDTAYESAEAPDVLFEAALAQGFAVGSHALDNAGHNCNMVTQAESLVMVKEMVVERFGPLRYTIGSGCSGGSLVQQQVANAFPGVYQGITPQCSFPDAWGTAAQYVDYVGLRAYLEDPTTAAEHKILPAQWPGIFGHANPVNQISFNTAIANSGDPSRSCPGVAADKVYSDTNPKGLRCSFQDYMRNVFGLDAQGKARRPISNVGIQYGLSGLLSMLDPASADPTRPPLTADQFIALNANAGGYDIDFNRTTSRTTADPIAQERVFRSGAVNTGAHLDEVAIIDLGGPEPGAFHDVYRKYAMRDRLIREHGTAANQVFWEGLVPLLGDTSFIEDAIDAVDNWLGVVESDKRDVPLARKLIDAKGQAEIAQRCVADGNDVPQEVCDEAVGATLFSSPRIEAGGGDQAKVNGVGTAVVGFADDRLDCNTMPIEQFVYAGQSFADTFTVEQQAALKQAFPTGVCDYSKPGKGFHAAVPWLRYQDDAGRVVYGGVPMGAAPQSEYFAARAVVEPGTVRLPATGPAVPLIVGGLGLLVLVGISRRFVAWH
jgi:hypothetical protein